MEIHQLIIEASGGKSKSIRALIEKGSQVLQELFITLDRLKEKQDVFELCAIIRYMNDIECVPILINRLNNRTTNDIQIDTAIYEALVNFSHIAGSQEILISELNNISIPLYQKKYLIESLGKSKHYNFSDSIIKMVESTICTPVNQQNLVLLLNKELEDGESYDKTLILLYSTEALLKKGLDLWTWIPEYLCTYISGNETDFKIPLRLKSVSCFNFYVSEKSYASLVQCLNDPYFEVRDQASKALFFIGTPNIVQDLLPLVQDDDFNTANNAMIYIETILGESPFSQFEATEMNDKDFEEWCIKKTSNLEKTYVYRDGEKFDLLDQIEKLKDKNLRNLVYKDLNLYTGQTFNYEDFSLIENQFNLFNNALEWYRENKNQFEFGFLYRNGRKVDLSFFQ